MKKIAPRDEAAKMFVHDMWQAFFCVVLLALVAFSIFTFGG